ncbi:MAG: hypothetical protein GXX85_06505 [Ignavibacteria bacterium]|nr:hypothetical protein [Ignavibacteria bacterium]
MNKLLIIFLIVFSAGLLNAQSDFEKIQNFKQKIESLNKEIESADSLSQLEAVMTKIESLKLKSEADKELLDKALYPDDYTKTFEKLDNKLNIAIQNASQISALEEEVTEAQSLILKLQQDITILTESEAKLRQENTALYNEIMRIKKNAARSKEASDSLKTLTGKLKDLILKRDAFIAGIIDSFFTTSFQKMNEFSQTDKADVIATIKSNNLLDKIKELINDNIVIIDKNLFIPEDLEEYKKEQKKFTQNWKKFGSSLVDIYASQNESKKEIYEIDFMLSEWDKKINNKIWAEVNSIFANYNIQLDQFSSGSDFESVLINYIQKEIDSSKISDNIDRVKNYSYFTEDIWEKEISEKWMPVLLRNGLLTEKQKENIDDKMDEWSDAMGGFSMTWIYIVGVVVLIAIITFWNSRRLKKKNEEQSISNEKNPV